LLATGLIPVISPVSRGPDGDALNVNADDAAAAVAEALGAEELLLVSNVPGVLSAGAVLPEIAAAEVEVLISDGVATGGMAPKLRAAARTIAAGVGAVRIGTLAMLADAGAGTRVNASSAVHAGD
jgi:acetylglutamate kinase